MIKFILFFAIAILLVLPVLFVIFSAVIFGAWRALKYETRFRKFFSKYENEEIARMVASGKIWTGQTADQLKDAKGPPLRIEQLPDQEIWIYNGSALSPNGLRVVVNQSRVQNWS